MSKFLVSGECQPYIIEAEDWEAAFWKAWDSLGDNLVSITAIPAEDIYDDL